MAYIKRTGKNEFTVFSQQLHKILGVYNSYKEAQKRIINMAHKLLK